MLRPDRVLRWTYIGRLSLASAIFVAAVFVWNRADVRSTLVATLALISASLITAGSVWYSARRAKPPGPVFAALQACYDLALVTAAVHVTGGGASPFVALYILITASASLLLSVRGALLAASLGSVLYAADVVWWRGPGLSLSVALQLTVFGLVALGTAYLSSRLREAGADRQELEQQLVLAKLQAEDILRNIGSGIVTSDAHGRLLYANPAAGLMLGFDHAAVIGLPIERVLAPAPVLAAALERAVGARERVSRGEATLTLGGRTIRIGLATTTMDTDGTPSGLSATAIFQDISDHKRMEELRLRTERLEGVAELGASLAHEIRNPLASIRSAVEQLARAPRATEDERTLSALIVRESDRLSRLLAEFLDFARTRVARLERLDLGTVTQTAARLAASHPDCHRGVRVSCDVPPEPLLVEGDEDLLHRAVFNIALNAVQAAPESGHVRVELASIPGVDVPRGVHFAGDAVALRVSDDGGGIPTELRERIFDPFFTTKPGGTGLGLPIAHRAIEAHRGVMLVDSGRTGTSFTVLLPRYQPPRDDPS